MWRVRRLQRSKISEVRPFPQDEYMGAPVSLISLQARIDDKDDSHDPIHIEV
jgi:hypothetical protein